MKLYLLIALCALGAASCVTSGDLERVAAEVRDFERVVQDRYATDDEVRLEAERAASEIEKIAREVEERTKDSITGLGEAADGGLIGLAGAIGVHLYRNHTRKKQLEAIKRNGGESA